MANGYENLKPFQPGEDAKAKGKRGGIASGKAKREKRLFKEVIEEQLGDTIESIVQSMINESLKGNVQATTFLRDTVGQKPVDKLEADVGLTTIRVDIEDE